MVQNGMGKKKSRSTSIAPAEGEKSPPPGPVGIGPGRYRSGFDTAFSEAFRKFQKGLEGLMSRLYRATLHVLQKAHGSQF